MLVIFFRNWLNILIKFFQENNGFVVDENLKGNFKEQLNALVETLDSTQKVPRNAIRLNVHDVIADGKFGEVISGMLYNSAEPKACQVHVMSGKHNFAF